MVVGVYRVDWSNQLCSLCKSLPRKAVKTTCDHIYCFECAKQVFTQPNPRCSKDRCGKFLLEREGPILFPDSFIRREYARLSVKCTNHRNGCFWIGKVHDLHEHIKECQLDKVKCLHCGCWIVPSTDQRVHYEFCHSQVVCSRTVAGRIERDRMMSRLRSQTVAGDSFKHHFRKLTSGLHKLSATLTRRRSRPRADQSRASVIESDANKSDPVLD